MSIENLDRNIIVVELPEEPEITDELKTVIDMVQERSDCDLIIDFSTVDIITDQSLSKLLKLRKRLLDSGHHLIFYSVDVVTKGIFTLHGLDGIFKFVSDKNEALAHLQMKK